MRDDSTKGEQMRKSASILALGVAVAFALAAGTATANRSIGLGGGPRASSAGEVVLLAGERLQTLVACDVTLLRTVAGRFPKVPGTQFGKVTGVVIDRGSRGGVHCRPNVYETLEVVPLANREEAGTHRELGGGVLSYDVSRAPAALWGLIYDSFLGTLPSITGINFHIEGFQYLVRTQAGGIPQECLYSGRVYGLMSVVSGAIRSITIVLERTLVNWVRGSLTCGRQTTLSGGLTVSPTLTIRLI